MASKPPMIRDRKAVVIITLILGAIMAVVGGMWYYGSRVESLKDLAQRVVLYTKVMNDVALEELTTESDKTFDVRIRETVKRYNMHDVSYVILLDRKKEGDEGIAGSPYKNRSSVFLEGNKVKDQSALVKAHLEQPCMVGQYKDFMTFEVTISPEDYSHEGCYFCCSSFEDSLGILLVGVNKSPFNSQFVHTAIWMIMAVVFAPLFFGAIIARLNKRGASR